MRAPDGARLRAGRRSRAGGAPWYRADVAIPAKVGFQPDLFLAATEAGAEVGSVRAGYEGHRGWISRIAVLRSHRGMGIGRTLIARAEGRLAALGCVEVDLQVVASNASTIAFYARSGYAIEARICMSRLLRAASAE